LVDPFFGFVHALVIGLLVVFAEIPKRKHRGAVVSFGVQHGRLALIVRGSILGLITGVGFFAGFASTALNIC
jgi:hypothetical protein